ncbi:MAG: GPR endopeptidase [Lachnospiraceae bacterium]|nr:GPR endopeptidase [Lachnospiraceae bacterium]
MNREQFEIRTDLALEVREDIEKKGEELKGVRVSEEERYGGEIRITTVSIETEEAARTMRKEKGKYLTIEVPFVRWEGEEEQELVAGVVADYIRKVLGKEERKSVLVVGLGNRDVTPDALGPQIIDNLCVNRHLIGDGRRQNMISAVAPGVMAQTGIETAVLVKGIVAETKPTAVIALDALAARNIHRLNTTIQLSDAGISPGSGVGNHRHALNKGSLGVPVIAIGIPTVVDAATIVNDTMNRLVEAINSYEGDTFCGGYEMLTEEERRMLVYELFTPEWRGMFVTPKNVDETINNMSITLAKAICYALLGKNRS